MGIKLINTLEAIKVDDANRNGIRFHSKNSTYSRQCDFYCTSEDKLNRLEEIEWNVYPIRLKKLSYWNGNSKIV